MSTIPKKDNTVSTRLTDEENGKLIGIALKYKIRVSELIRKTLLRLFESEF